MREIILRNGSKKSLTDWQREKGLSATRVSNNFTVSEMDCEGQMLIAEPLLELLEKYRELTGGKPVKVTAGYRTREHQKELQGRADLKAATYSPHTVGMAADVDLPDKKAVLNAVSIFLQAANILGLRIRLGYKQYLKNGQSFVHVDVCPEYYAAGKPYHDWPIWTGYPTTAPAAWMIKGLTW